MASTSNESIPSRMWVSALLVATQSFLFGYCFSSLNPCLVTGDDSSGSSCYNGSDSSCPKGSIYRDLNLSTIEAQTATSLTVAGAWIGCMLGSYPSERYGRKNTLLANNLFFIVGSALAASGTLPTLFIGRFVLGIGVGICSVVPPVLLSEIASTSSRGIITTLHQLMLTLAIFFVNILGFGLVTYVSHGWQYVQALAIVPCLFMFAMHSYIPESPKWLVSQYMSDTSSSRKQIGGSTTSPLQNDDSIATPEFRVAPTSSSFHSTTSENTHPMFVRARDTLQHRLRPDDCDIGSELQQIVAELDQDKDKDSNVSWSEVFACKQAMVIGCGLLFFQAFTGINTVVFYSTTIFGLAGFSQAIVGSAVWSFVNFCMTGVAARLIDQAGRRILLLRGTYIMLFALILLAGILLADNVSSKTQGDVAVAAVLIYVAGYAVSLGAVPWTIISEIMPTRQRVKAVSLFLSINWGSNLLIGLLTLTAIDGLGGVKNGMSDDETASAETKGVGYLYMIFGIVTACAIMFITFCVPETKGKTPETLGQPLLHGENETLLDPQGAKKYNA